jgi:capsular exopolysaccharide synthesis family protein
MSSKPTTAQRTAGSQPRSEGEPAIEFRRIYHLLRERARFIACCTGSFVVLALIYILCAHKIYASRAALVIEQQDRKVTNTLLDSQDVTQDDLHTLEVMKTVEQGLTADALVLRVIKINGLANNPHFLPPKADEPYTDDELLMAFSKAVTVKLRRGTRLIDVTAESDSPTLARQIAQSLVDSYLLEGTSLRVGISAAADGYLAKEAAGMRTKLEKSERDLQTYREQNNALSLEEKQNIVIDTLKDLNLKLNAARTQRMQSESDYAQYQKFSSGDPKALLALSSIGSSLSVLAAEKSVSDEQALIAMLTRRYRPEHPKYIQAQSQLAQMNGDLDRAILKSGESIGVAYNAALANEHKLEDALHEQEKLSFELNKISIPYNALVREVESDRALYQPILNRMKENDVTQALQNSPVRIAEPARVTSQPVRPKKMLVLAAAVILGCGVGLGRCLLQDAADSSLRTVDEAERSLNLPVVCAVPRLLGRKGKVESNKIVMVDDSSSITAEAFRSLRTVLGLHHAGDRQCVLFTSAAPGEGKTFCSVNCAVALAQQGYRTLLIDADLRRPSIAKAFERDPKAPGLTNFLLGDIPLAAALQVSGVENLTLLTAGSTPRNPAELLSNAKIAELFGNPAFASFDRVVFDTAPVNAVSDALSLIKHVDMVCLVIHAGKTPAKASARAQAAITAAKAAEIGLVLNCLPRHGGADCFYHYSAAYGSPGVYGAGEPSQS